MGQLAEWGAEGRGMENAEEGEESLDRGDGSSI